MQVKPIKLGKLIAIKTSAVFPSQFNCLLSVFVKNISYNWVLKLILQRLCRIFSECFRDFNVFFADATKSF